MRRTPAVFTLIAALGLAANVAAQEQPSGVEVGGHLSTMSSTLSSSTAGVGARLMLPVAPRVAIEGRVSLFPEHVPPAFLAQGGRTVELQLGARGTFIARRRFSVYGVLLPGLIHFTNTVTAISTETATSGGATHFALDLGTGIEFHPAARWIVYGEIAGPLYAVGGAELLREPLPSGATAVLELPASVHSTAQFNAGFSYRLGAAREPDPEGPAHPRWSVGAQAGHTTYTTDFNGTNLTRSATVGAFASGGILTWLDADAAFDVLLSRETVHSPEGGGRVLQALAGVKAGRRSKHVGYFAKFRAGARTRDSSVLSPFSPGRPPALGRSTTGVLDFGAVIESYAGRRLMIRVDAGDVVSFYSVERADSLNVAVGVGWRLGN